jgi:hypothetical protein
VYLKCFAATELRPAMPFLNPKNSNEEIIDKWREILVAKVYDKILAV